MRKLMIERIKQIIGPGPHYDSYVVDKIKVAIARSLRQDVDPFTKAGRTYIRNLDITTFDFDKMILQDEDLLYIFETAIAKFYQQH